MWTQAMKRAKIKTAIGNGLRIRINPPPSKGHAEIPISQEAESSNKVTGRSHARESGHLSRAISSDSPNLRSLASKSPTVQQGKSEAPAFDGISRVHEEFKTLVANVWNKIRQTLETTTIEHFSSLQESVESAFGKLRNLDIDISSLESRVEELFDKVRKYDEVRSTTSEKMPSETQAIFLLSAKSKVEEAQKEDAQARQRLQAHQATLKDLTGEVARLEKELEAAQDRKEECEANIVDATKDIEKTWDALLEAEGEAIRIQESTILTTEDEEMLNGAWETLESYRDEVICFTLSVD